MVKTKLLAIGLSVIVLVAVAAGFLYYTQLRGVGPALFSSSQNIVDILSSPITSPQPTTSPAAGTVSFGPLRLPAGFSLEVFAKDLPGARVIVKDKFGNYWVSQPGEGTVSVLQMNEGQVTAQQSVFRELNNPHGLALDPNNPLALYIAEENKISRVGLYSDGGLEKIADLPAGGGHYTRTIEFGPDGRLYVSIGSSCNVCRESDTRRAAILSMNKDGSDVREVATGLRNSVFFTWSEVDGRMWATDNGRDLLGDNLPPDEVNIIEAGKFYGWPFCYGAKVHDSKFDASQAAKDRCATSMPTKIDIPAHSAALGLAFIPESTAWPQDYWHDLLVAYHGSWNRSEPTGYKIVRWKLDAKGNVEGSEDFLTGFLGGGEAIGRPVDIMVEPGGVIYVTDDKAGVIYKVSRDKL